jgi:hypothetical protein
MAATVQVFDPPQCCPSGVCGPAVDPTLARFAADLDWLRGEDHSQPRVLQGVASGCGHMRLSERELPGQDSNLDKGNQNPDWRAPKVLADQELRKTRPAPCRRLALRDRKRLPAHTRGWLTPAHW